MTINGAFGKITIGGRVAAILKSWSMQSTEYGSRVTFQVKTHDETWTHEPAGYALWLRIGTNTFHVWPDADIDWYSSCATVIGSPQKHAIGAVVDRAASVAALSVNGGRPHERPDEDFAE